MSVKEEGTHCRAEHEIGCSRACISLETRAHKHTSQTKENQKKVKGDMESWWSKKTAGVQY